MVNEGSCVIRAYIISKVDLRGGMSSCTLLLMKYRRHFIAKHDLVVARNAI